MATRRMFINPTVVVLLCIIGQAIGASSGISAASSGQAFRRWVHGCHSMIPCPPPFCDNPVYGPGNCCGYCPEPTSSQDVTKAKEPETQEAGELGGIIENIADRSKRSAQLELFRRYFTTTTPRTTPYCPFPCTHQGTHFCFPLPCYINCVDAVKPPGACCYICQNGKLFLLTINPFIPEFLK